MGEERAFRRRVDHPPDDRAKPVSTRAQESARFPSVQLLNPAEGRSNPDKAEFMTLQGVASISDDRTLREGHWRDPFTTTAFKAKCDFDQEPRHSLG